MGAKENVKEGRTSEMLKQIESEESGTIGKVKRGKGGDWKKRNRNRNTKTKIICSLGR